MDGGGTIRVGACMCVRLERNNVRRVRRSMPASVHAAHVKRGWFAEHRREPQGPDCREQADTHGTSHTTRSISDAALFDSGATLSDAVGATDSWRLYARAAPMIFRG